MLLDCDFRYLAINLYSKSMVFKITPTGLYIVNKGKTIEVMTQIEFNLYYAQNVWWSKAKKFLGL
jgi:hypothetical protein